MLLAKILTPARGVWAGLALGLSLSLLPLEAAPDFSGGRYGGSLFYSHTTSDTIVSYDWGADGNLYYQTVTPSYTFGGLHRFDGAVTSAVVAASSGYAGASVVAVGGNVFYNTGDFPTAIFRYGPLSGTPGSNQAAVYDNYLLATDGANLFVSGAPTWGTTDLTLFPVDSAGVLGTPVVLGSFSGASGPMTFDGAGNLYYIAGSGDMTVYRWSASELAAAALGTPLGTADHAWADLSALSVDFDGGTSMLIGEDGNLWLTLSRYASPSALFSLGIDGSGDYAGLEELAGSDTLLGELREYNGRYFISSGSGLYEITAVPEPGAAVLLTAMGAMVFLRRRRMAA
jgi:hypothetical protein